MEPDWHLAQGIISALRAVKEIHELKGIMEAVANEIGCRFWHHILFRRNPETSIKPLETAVFCVWRP
ncbi:hypothetical protein [Sphingomonas sp. VDB2]|uniref:hypothetical protein n=1 Tax=Sphingomonas sp. VDB2 TaxID=3228751 RepID=UPI003A8014F0